MSAAEPSSSSPDNLKLLELVLAHIRANLSNIERVWGRASPQYASASQILHTQLLEQATALDVDVSRDELEGLMRGLLLDGGGRAEGGEGRK